MEGAAEAGLEVTQQGVDPAELRQIIGLSAYAIDESKPAKGYGENCLWIITERDRSETTLLLPSDY